LSLAGNDLIVSAHPCASRSVCIPAQNCQASFRRALSRNRQGSFCPLLAMTLLLFFMSSISCRHAAPSVTRTNHEQIGLQFNVVFVVSPATVINYFCSGVTDVPWPGTLGKIALTKSDQVIFLNVFIFVLPSFTNQGVTMLNQNSNSSSMESNSVKVDSLPVTVIAPACTS